MNNNYVVYHLHSWYSLIDSVINPKTYIDRAAELGMKAIAFTEHGNLYRWVEKKLYCEEKGIKYIHGVEAYLTQSSEIFKPINDNYHVILLAKNYEGVKEINQLLSDGDANHFYYKPRITFEEFLNLSDNIITTSACLGGPIWQIPKTVEKIKDKINEKNSQLDSKTGEYNKYVLDGTEKAIEKAEKVQNQINQINEEIEVFNKNIEYLRNMYVDLIKKFSFLEVQGHIESEEQKEYNKLLYKYAKKYNKELIAGTDTHSMDAYTSECRDVLINDKFKNGKVDKILYEDKFDLRFKTYEELVQMFKEQNVLPEKVYLKAIDNTNKIADMVEDFELDKSFKYPDIPGVDDEDAELKKTINEKFEYKIKQGIIDKNNKREYIKRIREEYRVFKKIGMIGFMLFMSRLMSWCRANHIPTSPCRGSVGGSTIAYISDIIDVDPVVRGTIFSRFANEDRKEIGDIDVDISPDQRDLVYDYIINSYPQTQTAFIITFGTQQALATIDSLGRSFQVPLDEVAEIKKQFKENDKNLKDKYPEIFEGCSDRLGFASDAECEFITKLGAKKKIDEDKIRECISFHKKQCKQLAIKYPKFVKYYNGLFGVPVSQSMHPAGIIVSPKEVDLPRDYGVITRDGKRILNIDMEDCHEISLVKYDILGLKQIQIERITCEMAGINTPLSHQIDWDDPVVWKHITDSPIGVFQFESKFAFGLMEKFKPKSIDDLTLVNASLRPSGESYRDKLLKRIPNKNPSPEIDKLLEKNLGYLVYQEDTIRFLQNICGLSGSEADNVRRAIGRKQRDRLEKALPQILEGYCAKSKSAREQAIKEANEFLQIIEDSANYQFGYNHATGYSMVSFLCTMLRTYFPAEFIAAYLNSAKNIDDVIKGDTLMRELDISYLNSPEIRERKVQIINTLSDKKITEGDLPKYPNKIKCFPPTFGKSRGLYTVDKESYSIYKGIGSIKGLNAQSANELYNLSLQTKYSNIETLPKKEKRILFYDLIKDIVLNTSLKKNQLALLIGLNYFRMFGGNQTLMEIYDTVDNLLKFKFDNETNKSFKKQDISFLKLNADMLMKYVTKEAPKTYTGINMRDYFYEYFATLEEKSYPLTKQLDTEWNAVGSYLTLLNTRVPCYVVQELTVYQFKNKPYLTLYNLKTGNTEKCSVEDPKHYINNTIKKGDIITNCVFHDVDKKKKVDGKIITLDGQKKHMIKMWTIKEKAS